MNKTADKLIIIIRSNNYHYDSRLIRAAETLQTIGRVMVLCWDRLNIDEQDEQSPGLEIIYYKSSKITNRRKLILSLPGWWFFIVKKLIKHNFDVVYACDIDTLIPSLLAAKIKRKRIVFDIYDSYAEKSIGLNNSVRKAISWFEKKILKWANLIIIPDLSRKKQLSISSLAKVLIIANVPNISRVKKKSQESNYFFYGGTLSNDRNIEVLLQYFSKAPNYIFEIAGFGSLSGTAKKYSGSCKNIRFLGPLRHQKILEKTQQSMLSFIFYDPKINNNKYASPNKLYEAMAFGVPVISNYGIGVDKYIISKNLGKVIKYGDIKALGEAVKTILNDPKQYMKYSQNIREQYQKYSPAITGNKLLVTIRKMIQKNNDS